MSELTPAVVEIKLVGEPVTLHCTLLAATQISNHFGGFGRAFDRVSALDLDAFTKIVKWGSGVGEAGAAAQAVKVFQEGLMNLTGPLGAYVGLLIAGGRTPGDAAPGEAQGGSGAN